MIVPDLRYVSEYLTQAEHDRLLALVDRGPWLQTLSRRVQHHGYRYDYRARRVDASVRVEPLPAWAAELALRLHQDELADELPDQLIVNEYLPGQGISRHVDSPACFGATVVSLSLGSPCVMELLPRDGGAPVPLLLEPRSALVLAGPARYEWRHRIPARKADRHEGRVLPRSRRVSLTFRKVLVR